MIDNTEYGTDHPPFDNFNDFTTREKLDKEVQRAIDGNFIGLVVRKVDEIGLSVRKVMKTLLKK